MRKNKNKKEETKDFNEQRSSNYKSAYDRILFEEILVDDDKMFVDFAKELIKGKPLVLNFKQTEIDIANKMVSFLSGVIFVIDGIIEKIDDKIYLFARSQEFKDGTLQAFINEFKKS